jgi:fibronectin-binding autotransporter adhesin
MKNTSPSSRQTGNTVTTGIFTRELPFLLALAAVLALQSNLRAGVQYFDPDQTPVGNDCTTGAGLGCTVTVGWPWDTTSSRWTPDGNCGGATTTWTDGNDAVFWGIPSGAGHVYTLTLDAPHTVSNLYFYATMSGTTITPNYTISGNTLTLITGNVTVDGGASPAGGSAGNLAEHLAATIDGTNGLTKLGGGMLYLDQANTFTGPVTVSGLFQPATGGAVYPTVANAISPNASGIYIINGGVINNSVGIVTTGAVVIVNGYITGNGGITAPSYELQCCRNGWNAQVSPLKDDYPLAPNGSTLVKTTHKTAHISGANTFTGGATISAGVLIWRGNSALGSSLYTNATINDVNTGTNDTALLRDSSASTANTNLPNDIVVANFGTGNTVIGNQNAAVCVLYSGALTLNRSAILTAPTNGAVRFAKAVSGTGGFTVGGLLNIGGPPASNEFWNCSAVGGGIVYLAAGNSFSGVVNLNLGTLNAQDATALGTTGVNFTGGTLQFGSSFDPSTVPLTFSAGAKLDTLGNAVTVANPIGNSESGSLTKLGTGTLTLQAANTYTGGTIVSVGTLEAQVDRSLSSGNVSVANGATLKLDTTSGIASAANLLLIGASPSVVLNFSGTSTIKALSFDGGVTFANSGTWGAVGSGAPNTDARLTGTGFLQVTMPGSATALTSSLNPAYYGSSVTFTAMVTAASGTPTGTVTFKDGATVLGTGSLSAGQTTLTTNNLSITGSPHAITAAYSGDASFLPSTSAVLSQVVNAMYSQTNAVLAITNNLNGTFKLALVGTPGAYYYMVMQTNVTQPMTNWTVVTGSTNLVTDPSGVWYFTATNPAPRYYRAAAVKVSP